MRNRNHLNSDDGISKGLLRPPPPLDFWKCVTLIHSTVNLHIEETVSSITPIQIYIVHSHMCSKTIRIIFISPICVQYIYSHHLILPDRWYLSSICRYCATVWHVMTFHKCFWFTIEKHLWLRYMRFIHSFIHFPSLSHSPYSDYSIHFDADIINLSFVIRTKSFAKILCRIDIMFFVSEFPPIMSSRLKDMKIYCVEFLKTFWKRQKEREKESRHIMTTMTTLALNKSNDDENNDDHSMNMRAYGEGRTTHNA